MIFSHHLALKIPDIWLWSAKWRKTIRLNRHLRFTPRGLDVITHLLRILTGQLSLGRAAISLSANSWKYLLQIWLSMLVFIMSHKNTLIYCVTHKDLCWMFYNIKILLDSMHFFLKVNTLKMKCLSYIMVHITTRQNSLKLIKHI